VTDPTKVVGDAGAISITVDTSKVDRIFSAVPKAGYFWMRDYFGQILGHHRKTWLLQKGTKFGRGKYGVKVYGVNEGPAEPGPNDVAYRVSPSEKRASSTRQATEFLNRLTAEAYTGGIVLPVHEFGQDIRSASWMSIAVKTRPGTPERWKLKYPGRKLLTLPSKRRDGKLLLYEVTQVGARGRPGAGKERPKRTKLRLRWILSKFVDMKPTLHMYDSWDALKPARDAMWARTATGMLRDLENPDARDM
jgi:hypothetical protein